MEAITVVGLDVHKRMTSVAIAESGRGGEVRFLGEIPSTPEALHRLVERVKARHRRLSFCYEAGPCGYGAHRLLSGVGQDCSVVARSLIPSRPGDRVKTNAVSTPRRPPGASPPTTDLRHMPETPPCCPGA